MKHIKHFGIAILVCISQLGTAQTKKIVNSFEKVVISPHIQTTFVEGNEESVTIEESTEPESKINIEVQNNTLRVYLYGAKEITKNTTIIKNGITRKVPIYKGKVLTVTITYKKINTLSIRGEQATLCKSNMINDSFNLKIYGQSLVVFNDVLFQNFNATIYGESTLKIKKGIINSQKITAYGEAIIDLIQIDNNTSKLKAFGEAQFKIQSSNLIKITAFGEAILQYKGNASIKKGINIGDVTISSID